MTARVVSWFSCGAASAVATKISSPDVVVYCDPGSEDIDNHRFLKDCEKWFAQDVTIIKSDKYSSTWDVWEKRKYISGIKGAPCTGHLKINPRLLFQRPTDIHIFGYTDDRNDLRRAKALTEHFPDLICRFPLIEKNLNKAACLAKVESAGLTLPRVYAMGLPNANCIPCCKATSPGYWAVVRKHFPAEYARMDKLSTELGVRMIQYKGKRIFLNELPKDQKLTAPIMPDCDILCHLVELDTNEDVKP